MARGKAEFSIMGCPTLKTEDNARLNERNSRKTDVDINGHPSKIHEEDPMKNLTAKGLVHHMEIPRGAIERCKGFIRDAIDEAQTKQENTMRGNATFTTMKGFGMETKGGTDPECLPNKEGQGMAEEDKLDNKATGSGPKKGAIRTDEDDLTMAKDVSLVGEKAKEDIADGYVSDIQGEKVSTEKGYDRYNEMVSKGMAADVSFNPHNVSQSLAILTAHTHAICKELDEGIETKGIVGETLRGAKETVRSGLNRAGYGAAAVTGNLKKTVGGAADSIKGVPRKVGNKIADTAAGIGSKTENVLRRGNARLTKPGVSEGEGALGRAANVVGRNRKAVGYGAMGAGAAGVGGAAYGAKKAVEDKCASGKTMKMKGIEGVETKGSRLKNAAKIAGLGAGVLGVTAGMPAAAGAIAAGKGKRAEGAKEGLKSQVIPLAHPIKATRASLESVIHPIDVYNPDNPHSKYVGGLAGAVAAGRKVRRNTED